MKAGEGGGGVSERVWERRARTRTATRNPVPPENAQPAHRRGAPPPVLPALPPQDRPAGSPRPCVTAPARGKCPAFGGSKSGQSVPAPKKGAGTGVCTPSFPSSLHPSFPLPLSWALSPKWPALLTPHSTPSLAVPTPPASCCAHLGSRPRQWQ